MAKARAKTKPMRSGPRIVDETPQTLEEATLLVSRIARLMEDAEAVRKKAAPRVLALLAAAARKKADADKEAAPLIEEAMELAALVRGFAASRRDELTKKGKTLTVALPTGDTLRWRNFPPSADVDEDAFFAEVRKKGAAFEKLFIRTTDAPDRDALLKHRDKADLLRSVTFVSQQVFEIVPEHAENHLAIGLTDKKPKWKEVPPPKPKNETKKKK